MPSGRVYLHFCVHGCRFQRYKLHYPEKWEIRVLPAKAVTSIKRSSAVDTAAGKIARGPYLKCY